MINVDDYFGGLTEEEYVKQTEEHFKWLDENCGPTDDEVIKALKCCSDYALLKCLKCPKRGTSRTCMYDLSKEALDLINRQKATEKELRELLNILGQENGKLCKEIERLKAIADAELDSIHDLGEDYERLLEEEYELIEVAKIKAIKEFWQKVRVYAVVMGCYHIVEYGDGIVKEMVEGKNR